MILPSASGTVSPLVIGDGLFQGLPPHDRAVDLLLGQPAQIIGDILVGDLGGLLDGHPLDHFRQGRGRGDGAGAAEGLEPHVLDAAVFVQLEGELQGVAAGDVAHQGRAVRVFHLADVAGMEEMVYDLIGIFPHKVVPFSNPGPVLKDSVSPAPSFPASI